MFAKHLGLCLIVGAILKSECSTIPIIEEFSGSHSTHVQPRSNIQSLLVDLSDNPSRSNLESVPNQHHTIHSTAPSFVSAGENGSTSMHGEEIDVNSSNSESEEASSDQGSNDDSDSKLHQSSPTQSGGGEEPDGNHEPLLNFLLGPDTSVDSMSQPTEVRMDSSDSPDLSSSKTAEKLEPSGSVAASPTSKSDDKKGPKSSSTVTVFLHRQTETSDGSVDSSLGHLLLPTSTPLLLLCTHLVAWQYFLA